MAKKIVNVVYKVDDKELTEAKQKIQSISKETKESEKNMAKAGSTGAKAFGLIGGVLAAIGFASIGKQIFDITAQFQKLSAVLTNTLGSRSAAQKALADIKQFAASTPFSVVEMTNAFVKLANQGFKPTINEMRKLGDLASAQGKSFDQLTEAIIDGQTGEFERLKEFGIRASKEGDKVSFTFKGVKTQTDFTAEAMREYILSLGDLAGVSGGMAAISGTLGGKISNLGDNVDALLSSIGNSSAGLIGSILDLVNNAIGGLNSALDDNIGNLQKEHAEITTLVKAATTLNVPTEVRSALLTELNQKYPDFLKNLNIEKVTNEELTSRLEDVNEQFIRKIALVSAEKALIDIQDEITDSVLRERDARKEIERLQQNRAEIEGNVGGALGLQADVDFKISAQQAVINSQIEKRNGLSEELVSLTADLTSALNLYNTSSNDYFDGVKEGNKTVQAATEATKKLTDAQKKARAEFMKMMGFTTASEKVKAAEEEAKKLEKIENDANERSKKNQEFHDKQRADKLKEQKELEYEIAEEAANKRLELEQRVNELAMQLATGLVTHLVMQREIDTQGIRDKYDRELELAGDNDRAKEQIEKERDKKLAEAEARNKEIQKRNARSKILIDTAVAVIKTFSQFGYPAGIIPAALMTALGGVALANVRKFKKGEVLIDGPGTTTSDSIPALLSKKESVINADASMASPKLLNAINDRKIDDRILYSIAANGGRQANFDTKPIVDAINKNKVDYDNHGYTIYKGIQQGSNFKRIIRSKVQGY